MSLVGMRSVTRLAWRSARRSAGRSLLIITLIASPVTLMTAVATIAQSSLSTPAEVAAWEAISFVAGAVALFATGLIAAAALVIGARRQLRELGLVGAIGGEHRHVLATMMLTGTMLGLIGSVGGAVLGVVGAYMVHPFADDLVGHSVGPVVLDLFALMGAMAMGTAAATLAAVAPARAAAKVTTLDALAGRTRPPRPPGRVAGVGLLGVGAGGVVTVLGTQTDNDLFQAGGFIAMLSGFLLAVPLLVAVVGRIATRLPATGRLAARDAARHGRRTGAAVAAAVIALSAPIAVSTYSLSTETYERQSFNPGDGEDTSEHKLARTVVTAGSVPIALAIVAVAVALVSSESRRSRQILVAVGAGPMAHRTLLAMTAALLALIAAVLAVPAGLGPMVALWASQPAGPSRLPLVIPWATIGVVVFVVPLVAALGSAALARTPDLSSLLRRGA